MFLCNFFRIPPPLKTKTTILLYKTILLMLMICHHSIFPLPRHFNTRYYSQKIVIVLLIDSLLLYSEWCLLGFLFDLIHSKSPMMDYKYDNYLCCLGSHLYTHIPALLCNPNYSHLYRRYFHRHIKRWTFYHHHNAQYNVELEHNNWIMASIVYKCNNYHS